MWRLCSFSTPLFKLTICCRLFAPKYKRITITLTKSTTKEGSFCSAGTELNDTEHSRTGSFMCCIRLSVHKGPFTQGWFWISIDTFTNYIYWISIQILFFGIKTKWKVEGNIFIDGFRFFAFFGFRDFFFLLVGFFFQFVFVIECNVDVVLVRIDDTL